MRYVYLISTLVGIAALAAIIYFIASRREMEPVVIYKTTGFNTDKTDPVRDTTPEASAFQSSTDPEVAAYFQRYLHPNTGTD